MISRAMPPGPGVSAARHLMRLSASATAPTYADPMMWSVSAEPVDSPDAVALLRDYFAELTVRYFHRETSEQEIDETVDEFPSTGLHCSSSYAPAEYPPAASACTRRASSPASTSGHSFAAPAAPAPCSPPPSRGRAAKA